MPLPFPSALPPAPRPQFRTFWDEAFLAALSGAALKSDYVQAQDAVVANAVAIADRAVAARQQRQRNQAQSKETTK